MVDLGMDNPRKRFLAPFILGIIYIGSRIIYHYAGIQFDAGSLTRNWHYIDTYLLKNDLWKSIFYMHTQPPLMNLLMGVTVQLFPGSYMSVAQGLHLFFGMILIISLYYLGIKLGLLPRLSFIIAVWFSISPATILFENKMIYAYPLLVLLVLSIEILGRFIEKRHVTGALIFSFCLAAMALTWGLFHIVWLVGCFGIVTFLLKGYRNRALWLLPAFLLVFAWYAKNGILYGSYTASSWAGLNLFKMVTLHVPGELRAQWVKEGKISELALVPPYRSPEVYLEYFPETQLTGVPLLDDYEESNGYRNQHHLSYVYAGERYIKDSIQMVVIAPQYYLRSIPHSLYIFLHSASDYKHLRSRKEIDRFDTLWNRTFYWQWHKNESLEQRSYYFSPYHIGWLITLQFVIVLLFTPVYLWRQRAQIYNLNYGLMFFMYWNILFVTAAGILLDIGENNRTRFAIDPLIVLLSAFFLQQLVINVKRRIAKIVSRD